MEVECDSVFGDVAKLINKGATSSSALIKLNVGGKEYETTVDTLTRISNTFFTHLLSKPEELQVDDKGRIFIDGDGDLFRYVLFYLRTGNFYLPPDHHQRLALKYEAKFYQLNDLFNFLSHGYFSGGNLLDPSQKLKLNEFYGVNNQRWKLLFKATVHGFSASTFHSLCDNKGPTMTIIKSSFGFLFGGFTKESWAGDIYKSDAAAFIFTLTNPHGIAATKFAIHSDKIHAAMGAFPSTGPRFGDHRGSMWSDIWISDNSNTNIDSFTYLGHTYTDTTGKRDTLFTGSRNFRVSDIEVFGLTSQ